MFFYFICVALLVLANLKQTATAWQLLVVTWSHTVVGRSSVLQPACYCSSRVPKCTYGSEKSPGSVTLCALVPPFLHVQMLQAQFVVCALLFLFFICCTCSCFELFIISNPDFPHDSAFFPALCFGSCVNTLFDSQRQSVLRHL